MMFQEIIDSGAGHFMRTEQFEEAGIKLVDNTPEEIKTVALEMADGIPDSWISDYMIGKTSAQSAFWDKFPRSMSQYNNRPLHGEIRMRIGAEFLRQYQEPKESLPELYRASPEDFSDANAEQWARAGHGD